MQRGKYVVPFSQLRMTDVESVGGKNSSLGEMLSQLADKGIRVPDGFATTADAFRAFLNENNLTARINARLSALDVDDVKALTTAGNEIRGWVTGAPLPAELQNVIVYAAGRSCAFNVAAAVAFIAFARGKDAKRLMRANGLDPA